MGLAQPHDPPRVSRYHGIRTDPTGGSPHGGRGPGPPRQLWSNAGHVVPSPCSVVQVVSRDGGRRRRSRRVPRADAPAEAALHARSGRVGRAGRVGVGGVGRTGRRSGGSDRGRRGRSARRTCRSARRRPQGGPGIDFHAPPPIELATVPTGRIQHVVNPGFGTGRRRGGSSRTVRTGAASRSRRRTRRRVAGRRGSSCSATRRTRRRTRRTSGA